jgi:hypothetical protein
MLLDISSKQPTPEHNTLRKILSTSSSLAILLHYGHEHHSSYNTILNMIILSLCRIRTVMVRAAVELELY